MRDNLLGYLIGALEAADVEQVARALQSDPDLHRLLDILRQALEPLELCRESIQAPPDLAGRTWILIQQSMTISDNERRAR